MYRCHSISAALGVLFWLFVTFGVSSALGQEEGGGNHADGVELDALTTPSQTFSNVVVFSQDSQNVFFKHASGLGSVRVSELNPDTLRRLGFTVEEPSESVGSSTWTSFDASSWLRAAADLSALGVTSIVVLVILAVGLYLYCSFLFWLICVKAGGEPGITVWLPVFQFIPMLRAAKMSILWPLLLLLFASASVFLRAELGPHAWILDIVAGVAGLVCFLTWSVKICAARKKSRLLAPILVVPGLNFFALLYLAGSK
jgi:hypothetical protein